MEGVENIAPLTDSTPSQVPNTASASSSNNKNVPSAETATEQSTISQKKVARLPPTTFPQPLHYNLSGLLLNPNGKNTRLPLLPLHFLEKN